jgi:hypothetical protein
MASDLHKYSVQESLNLMMNSGEDALKVDLDNATITAGELDVGIAHSDDSVLVYGYDGSSNQKISTDASGNVQIDIVSGGSADAAHVDDAAFTLGSHSGMMMMGFAGTQSVDANDAGAIAMETDGSVHIHDGGNTITVDGTVTANLSATDNAVLDTIDAVLDTIKTDTGTIDSDTDAIKTAVEAVNQAAEGAISATTQRVTIATDDDGVAHLATIAGDTTSVDGKITACNTGAVVLAASDGTDIGDVDVASLPASTNTLEVVGDVAENENAAGNPVLIGGRYDNSGANDGGLRTLDTTDVGALALDPKGVLLTKDFTGQAGSILVTGTSAVAAGYGKFIAIQFIEDTVFSSSANGLSASDVNRWPDDTGIGSDISSNGAAIDGVTFPQGMTIFGRWDDFTLASGKVIAYIGYV